MKKLAFLCLILSLSACTRNAPDASRLRIQVPAAAAKVGAMATIPAGFKKCYAVNVTASDLATTSRPCGKALGAFTGFVEAGGTVELSLSKGTGRTVDLYAYLTPDKGAACPALTTTCDAARECNSYRVATATGVDTSQATTELTMTVDFPGLAANAVSQDAPTSNLCSGSIAAAMTSAGIIVDSSFTNIPGAPSTAAAATFYKRKSATTYEIVTRSHLVSDGTSLVNVRPQVRGLSRKPGSGVLYAMLSDGSLVAMSESGEYTLLDSASCPFTTCSLPRWFKSFALGTGPEVFGLDHGGGLWRIGSNGSPTFVTTLPPYIQQVSMN